MVRKLSNRSDGPSAQHQAFIEVEAVYDASQLQQRLPELAISLEQGLELQVSSREGVDLAISFINKLQAPRTSHHMSLECGLEGGAR